MQNVLTGVVLQGDFVGGQKAAKLRIETIYTYSASSFMSNGVCSCPAESIITASSCVCQPDGSSMVNNVCTCFPGASIVNSVCQCTTKGSSISGKSCVCNPKYYKDGWLPNGDAWCSNVNMCCTKCMAKTGKNWVCSDWSYYKCTNSGKTVLG
ncbi:Hypothetical_protein [Hexamita inflata]|uniref:Hypothetical_protein n=1 Tax=Hexamita inflata TaxID=28002 RepID=A0AA86U8T4_9EUKA|nr:Hypothetical protein HINF_LOCUS33359 [Hexamita inflata]